MPDILINSDVSTFHVQPGLVVLDANVAYYFFGDETNDDFFYTKTLDGGETWETPVSVVTDATDVVSGAIWWDQWTPGDAGTLIHIVVARDAGNDFRYRSLDTSNDSLSTDVQVASFGVGGGSGYRLAITKADNANLYIKLIASTPANQRFMRSIDGGASWALRTDTPINILSTDRFFLFPAGWRSNSADVAMIWADDNSGADTLNLLENDDTGNSWTSTLIATNVDTANRAVVATATIRRSDGHLLAFILDRVTQWTSVTVRVFDVFGAASITELAPIVINPDQAGFALAACVFPNDHILAVYFHEGAGVFDTDVRGMYVRSIDDGVTWESEVQFTAGDTRNIDYFTVPYNMPDGGFFAPIFVDTDNAPREAYLNLDNSLVVAAAVTLPPILAAQLGLVETYTSFFGTNTIADLLFDLKLTAWREAISPKAFVLPSAGITGVALSLNAIDFILTLEGTIYGTHTPHPVTSGVAHIPDEIDLEEVAIMFNREGLANRAFVRLILPSGTREYRGVIKSMKLEQRGGEFSVWNFTLVFQVLWTASFPQWRGWT